MEVGIELFRNGADNVVLSESGYLTIWIAWNCLMDGSDSLPDMRNAVEWRSGRTVLDERFALELFLCRSGNPEGPELPLPHPWYSLGFERVASFAKADMSLMLQYYNGDDPTIPLIEEVSYDGDRTFVEGFTVNTEAHGNSWKHYRIVTQDDVIDVITDRPPVMTRCPLS